MVENSRTYNSITNSIYGIVASCITIILNFFVRIILVRELGAEINGLHNLFQSIATVMTLMELGISSAMIIHLYEPVKLENVKLIQGIMYFYKKVYTYIALIFAIAGIFVAVVFLDKVVTTTIDLKLVRIYFLLFLTSFVLNYLTYYKRSLLFAEQKNRISIGITAACEILFRSIQILLLIVFHQYILFLLLTICEKVVSNILCTFYVNKYHPYLRKYREELDKDKKLAIFNTVKPLMINQIANTVQHSAKSILISVLLGNISIVGYYGNYQLAISMVEMIYSQFGGAFTSSFGNLAVEGDKQRMARAYKNTAFLLNWIACIFCGGFLACIQDFVMIFFGSDFVLGTSSVVVLTLNLIIYLLNIPIISMQNAMGLHNLDVMYMIVQAIVAIALGLIGGRIFNMPGIFIGLLIPLIIFTFIRKGIIITRSALNFTASHYLSFIGVELIKVIICAFGTMIICSNLSLKASIISIIVKSIIAIIVGIVVPILFSWRTLEFKYSLSLLSRYTVKFIKI